MMNKDTATSNDPTYLLSGFIFEMESGEDNEKRYNEIRKVIFNLLWSLPAAEEIKKYPEIKYLGVMEGGLDPETMNCRQCENCRCWTTDNRHQDILDYLPIGREVDGRYICVQCEDAPNM